MEAGGAGPWSDSGVAESCGTGASVLRAGPLTLFTLGDPTLPGGLQAALMNAIGWNY